MAGEEREKRVFKMTITYDEENKKTHVEGPLEDIDLCNRMCIDAIVVIDDFNKKRRAGECQTTS